MWSLQNAENLFVFMSAGEHDTARPGRFRSFNGVRVLDRHGHLPHRAPTHYTDSIWKCLFPISVSDLTFNGQKCILILIIIIMMRVYVYVYSISSLTQPRRVLRYRRVIRFERLNAAVRLPLIPDFPSTSQIYTSPTRSLPKKHQSTPSIPGHETLRLPHADASADTTG